MLFYAIAAFLCTAVALFAPVFGDRTAIVAMFTPLLSVLVMLIVVTRDGYTRDGRRALGLHRAGLAMWSIALYVPVYSIREWESALGAAISFAR